MIALFTNGFFASPSPWADEKILREEIYGPDGLEKLGESSAAAEGVGTRPCAWRSVLRRLEQNALALSAASRALANQGQSEGTLDPAAIRFLDNFHLIDEQVRATRDELTGRLCRHLPASANGPLAGHPRLVSLLMSYVAHSDSYVDLQTLKAFVAAFSAWVPRLIAV